MSAIMISSRLGILRLSSQLCRGSMTDATSPKRERLEVSDDKNKSVASLVRTGQKPDMSAPLPPSSVLSRVQDFLPQMAAANEKLTKDMQNQPAENFDVEVIGEGDSQHVEMDIACGVLELKDDAAEQAAEAVMAAGQCLDAKSAQGDSSSDSSDESSDSDEEEREGNGEYSSRGGKKNPKHPKGQKSSGITVLE